MIRPVTDRTLLLLEDDLPLAQSIVTYFGEKNNTVHHATTLAEAWELLARTHPDILILDVLLPDGEGLDILRTRKVLPPAVVISSLGSDADRLNGFMAGAVDYIVKPFSPEVLEAHVSLRLLPPERSVIVAHGLTADATARIVTVGDTPIALTGSEFNILWFLMSHPGHYYAADTLYEQIWDMPSLRNTSVKYHISNLRRKLKEATGKELIATEFGRGYCFRPSSVDAPTVSGT